jgi:predicted RNA-binding protein with EMAP domain
MSVAAAVERKISIVYEKSLLQNLRRAYLNVENIVNNKNAQVLEVLDRNLQTLYGKEGSQRIKEEDFDSVAKPFLAQREFKMVYPDNLLKKTEEIEREGEDFLAEVDAVLSESNARTDIEI